VFEQGFVFLVINPDADDLRIKVLDMKNKEKEIASAVIRISDIIKMENMELERQPVHLKVSNPVNLKIQTQKTPTQCFRLHSRPRLNKTYKLERIIIGKQGLDNLLKLQSSMRRSSITKVQELADRSHLHFRATVARLPLQLLAAFAL
jgi:hypothetical protein